MSKQSEPQNIPEVDAIWGAEQIGAEIGRSAAQVRELFKAGVLKDSVQKLGHKTFLGSRAQLRKLAIPKH